MLRFGVIWFFYYLCTIEAAKRHLPITLLIMKLLTNILLFAAIVVYLFMPVFDVQFMGGWTGFAYTADTISNSESLWRKLYALLPFVSCFGAITFNCLRHRYWGFIASLFIVAGILFFVGARHLLFIEPPQIYQILGLGTGFNVDYGLMITALVAVLVSILPLPFYLKIYDLKHRKK